MANKVDFDVQIESGVIIMAISKSFDYENVGHFRKLIYVLARQNLKHIILNLNKLSFIDSAGIGTLLAAVRFIYQQNGNIQVVASSPRIVKLFENVNTESILPIQKDLSAALLAITQAPHKDSEQKLTLKKIEDFFNPRQMKGSEEIITEPSKFHLKRDTPVYVDIIGEKQLRRIEGRIDRLLDGQSGLVIQLGETILREEPREAYCIVSYFVGNHWYEFEDYPFRFDEKHLWFHFPQAVALIERRSSIRIQCEFPVTFQICDVVGTTRQFKGTAVNIGEGGILLKSKETFPVCDCVGLQFSLPGNMRELIAIGRVVRKMLPESRDFLFGVHFLILNDAARKQINHFVQRRIAHAGNRTR